MAPSLSACSAAPSAQSSAQPPAPPSASCSATRRSRASSPKPIALSRVGTGKTVCLVDSECFFVFLFVCWRLVLRQRPDAAAQQTPTCPTVAVATSPSRCSCAAITADAAAACAAMRARDIACQCRWPACPNTATPNAFVASVCSKARRRTQRRLKREREFIDDAWRPSGRASGVGRR